MALERAVMEASSSDEDHDPLSYIPRASNYDAGMSMELLLARESMEHDAEVGNEKMSIMDQSQFRNTEVRDLVTSAEPYCCCGRA